MDALSDIDLREVAEAERTQDRPIIYTLCGVTLIFIGGLLYAAWTFLIYPEPGKFGAASVIAIVAAPVVVFALINLRRMSRIRNVQRLVVSSGGFVVHSSTGSPIGFRWPRPGTAFEFVDWRVQPDRRGAPFVFGARGLRNLPLSSEGRDAIASAAQASGLQYSVTDWEAFGKKFRTELFQRSPWPVTGPQWSGDRGCDSLNATE